MSAKLPKYAKAQEAAPGEEQRGENNIQTEQQEHTSVPPAEAEEERTEELRSGGQRGKCAAGYFSPSVRASCKLQPPLILRERLHFIYSLFNPGAALGAPPQTSSFLLRCDDEFQLLLLLLVSSQVISGDTTRSLAGSAAEGGCG